MEIDYIKIKNYFRKIFGDTIASFLIKVWRNTYVKGYDFIMRFFLAKKNKEGTQEVFNYIYKKNIWGSKESKSGPGSEEKHTIKIRTGIIDIINRYNIQTLIDAPCGDVNWIQPEKLGVQYVGCDIVVDLINSNKERFHHVDNITFQTLDITTDVLPDGDMILCRECLQHLSYENIDKFLNNIRQSNIKYLLTTTHLEGKNKNILNGGYFDINLSTEPFNLIDPIELIEEDKVTDTGIIKYLALYDLTSL